MRHDGRSFDELRPLGIIAGVNPNAEGSAEICLGGTRVLISATIEKQTPDWRQPDAGGWITAEYGMLPRATQTRSQREAVLGKQSGRSMEIQRLIGRALRTAVDLSRLPGLTIRFDCDVLSADGGTRTAAISGAWVALCQAVKWAVTEGLVEKLPEIKPVSAVSVGVVNGAPMLDLDYAEDSQADFDMNVIFAELGKLIEVQGSAERKTVEKTALLQLLELAEHGGALIMAEQKKALRERG